MSLTLKLGLADLSRSVSGFPRATIRRLAGRCRTFAEARARALPPAFFALFFLAAIETPPGASLVHEDLV